MSSILPLVLLAALAGAATLLLERGGRRGYGWVTGSEFALAGLALGPLGLDLVSQALLDRAELPIALGASWVGLGLGLRLRKTSFQHVPAAHVIASQVEPLVALVVLRLLIEAAARLGGMTLPSEASWALAAAGAGTTRSMMDWARAQQGARGPLTEALRTICTFNDATPLLALALLFAAAPPHETLLATVWQRLGAMGFLSLGLAALVLVVVGRRRFRPQIAWLALFGSAVLGTGLALELGLLPVTCLFLCGVVVARTTRHADGLEEVTRSTQRPVIQVLLLLAGASVRGGGLALAAALLFTLLRGCAKAISGAAVSPLAAPRFPTLGLGLLGGGGVLFAAAFSASQVLPGDVGGPLLAGAVAMVIVGDAFGPPALRSLLLHAGEMPESAAAAGPQPQP